MNAETTLNEKIDALHDPMQREPVPTRSAYGLPEGGHGLSAGRPAVYSNLGGGKYQILHPGGKTRDLDTTNKWDMRRLEQQVIKLTDEEFEIMVERFTGK